MRYKLAALGGTFDRIHRGHHQLIQTALNTAEKVIIGVTLDDQVKSKHLSNLIEPFEIRVKKINEYLQDIEALDRVSIIQLRDIYGPTISDPTIDVIVVSTQTKAGGILINEERMRKKLVPLPIIEAQMVSDDGGKYLSSSEIRSGHVSRQGQRYSKLLSQDIHFTEAQLSILKHPQGKLIKPEEITPEFLSKYESITLVGDIITEYFIKRKLNFSVGIIDGVTQRNQHVNVPENTIDLNKLNPRGALKHQVVESFLKVVENNAKPQLVVKISGEEDLLTFIPVLTEPLNSLVLYGQPGVGIVMIQTDEAAKLRIAQLIDTQFK